MKLVSFRKDGIESYGAVVAGGIVDLGARLGTRYQDLKAVLAGDAMAEALEVGRAAEADIAIDAIEFMPVIANPGKIFCVGHNYEAHRVETQRDKTAYPLIFLRLAESLAGHGMPLICPRESRDFDFEGEIAIVIGKGGRRIAEADAWEHIAGYSCFNDGSVRDWQKHASQFTPGKNFVATGAFGPWLVSSDELPPGSLFELTTRLNGEVMQHATTDMLIFSLPRLIAYCSTFVPLAAGDVIVTGTPGGVGARRTPPVFMKPGDVVEIEVDRIGTLRNTIGADRAVQNLRAAAAPAHQLQEGTQ